MVSADARKYRTTLFTLALLLVISAVGCSPSVDEPEGITEQEIGRKYAPEELRTDVSELLTTIEEVHPDAFALSCAESVRDEFAAIRAGLDEPATRIELYRKVAPVVAGLGDGHTSLPPPEEEWRYHLQEGGTCFPFRVELDGRRMFVTAPLTAESEVSPRSEILSINAVPAEEIIDELLPYVSGERESFRLRLLNRLFPQLLWLIYEFDGAFTVEVSPPDGGEVQTITIPGATEESLQSKDTTVAGEPEPFSFRVLSDGHVGLLDFRSFTDPGRFDRFLEETFTRLQDEGIEHLIIDIRENGGGNSSLGDALLAHLTDEPFTQFSEIHLKVSEQIKRQYRWRWMEVWRMETGSLHVMSGEKKEPGDNPLRFEGDTYLLTSPFTFSSATSFAAAFKHYEVGTVVGEETGGLRESFGDLYRTQLPSTRLRLNVSHKRFISPGDDERGITPHYEVSTRCAGDGTDPVLDFVREQISGGEQ